MKVKYGALAVIAVSVLFIVRQLPVNRAVAAFSSRIEELGVWGLVLFGAVYVVGAVLFVPGAALTLAAGAVFGLFWGMITVSLASTTAAACAFLIARYLARDAVAGWAQRYPRFGAIDRAIGQGGWKVIALLRLSPAIPFSLSNYLFGLTPIRFWPYVLTSWLAMLPGTFMYIYLGYAGRAGIAASAGADSGRSSGEWVLLGVGLLATVVVTVYVTRLARAAVKEHTVVEEQSTVQEQATVDPSPPRRGGTQVAVAAAVIALCAAACTYHYRASLNSLFGPPPVTSVEAYAVKPDGPVFEHAVFDELLKRHVNETGGVDYQKLLADAGVLDAYMTSLGAAPFEALGRNEKLALLINAYNAFTLRLILDNYPLASIKDIPAERRWDAERWRIGGHIFSLNEIEHDEIRPNFKEPRIHFALVCAAVGCPPLRAEAYTANRLNEQLTAQARFVHEHDRWFRYDAGSEIVSLTSLYRWYRTDFEQAAGSLLEYVARHAPRLKSELTAGRLPAIEWLDYDWSLNNQEIIR